MTSKQIPARVLGYYCVINDLMKLQLCQLTGRSFVRLLQHIICYPVAWCDGVEHCVLETSMYYVQYAQNGTLKIQYAHLFATTSLRAVR
jgi:hypothetical protein